MNPLVKFMASTASRITCIIAGIVLIAFGPLVDHRVGEIVLIVVGLLPLVAGLFDFYSFAPLCEASLSSKQIRSANLQSICSNRRAGLLKHGKSMIY